MSISPETQIVILDPESGAAEARCTWAEFIDANGAEVAADVAEQWKRGETALSGLFHVRRARARLAVCPYCFRACPESAELGCAPCNAWIRPVAAALANLPGGETYTAPGGCTVRRVTVEPARGRRPAIAAFEVAEPDPTYTAGVPIEAGDVEAAAWDAAALCARYAHEAAAFPDPFADL